MCDERCSTKYIPFWYARRSMSDAKPSGWLGRQMVALNRRPFGRVEAAFYETVAAPAVRALLAPVLLKELEQAAAGTVLDVGCGSGALTHDLVAPGRTVVGVDPSTAQLGRLRRRAVPIESAAASAAALPFDANGFDAVVSSCAIKHWPVPPDGLVRRPHGPRRGILKARACRFGRPLPSE